MSARGLRLDFSVLTRGKVATRPYVALCRKLFAVFSHNRVVLRSRSRDADFSDLTVAFVGAARSKRLNKKYRKKDYATDVLSFSSGAPGQGLGELVLCVPVLKRQAKENGHSFEKEAEMMIVHGFLHLLGYDHEKSRKEELKMMRLQDKLLRELTR